MSKREPIVRVTAPVQNVRFPSRCVDCDGPAETTCTLYRKIGRVRVKIPAPACRDCAAWRKKTRFAWYGGWLALSLFFAAYVFSGEVTGFWQQRAIVVVSELIAFGFLQVWFFHYAEENLYNAFFNRLWIERFTVAGSIAQQVTLAVRDVTLRDEVERLSSHPELAPPEDADSEDDALRQE